MEVTQGQYRIQSSLWTPFKWPRQPFFGILLNVLVSPWVTFLNYRTSTASARSQWALPDLDRKRQIGVGATGPQRATQTTQRKNRQTRNMQYTTTKCNHKQTNHERKHKHSTTNAITNPSANKNNRKRATTQPQTRPQAQPQKHNRKRASSNANTNTQPQAQTTNAQL